MELEAPVVGSSSAFVHAQALAALQAGKHVICEKPLAMTVEQADEMIATARERNVLLVANLVFERGDIRLHEWIPTRPYQHSLGGAG